MITSTPVSRTPEIAADAFELAQDILNSQAQISSGLAGVNQAQAYGTNVFNSALRSLRTGFDREFPGITAGVAASGFGNSGLAARAISRAFEDQQTAVDSVSLEYQNQQATLAAQAQALNQYYQQLALAQEQALVYAGLYGGVPSNGNNPNGLIR